MHERAELVGFCKHKMPQTNKLLFLRGVITVSQGEAITAGCSGKKSDVFFGSPCLLYAPGWSEFRCPGCGGVVWERCVCVRGAGNVTLPLAHFEPVTALLFLILSLCPICTLQGDRGEQGPPGPAGFPGAPVSMENC